MLDTRATDQVIRHRNGFYVIPEGVSWMRVPAAINYEPVYWSMSNYTGDQVHSNCIFGQINTPQSNLVNLKSSGLEFII